MYLLYTLPVIMEKNMTPDIFKSKFKEFIKRETLSLDIIFKKDLKEEIDLNGHTAYIDVEKA